MEFKYFGLNSLRFLLSKISEQYATKEIVSTSASGLVPAPMPSDNTKVLKGDCTWQYESVSLSDDNSYVPLEDGGVSS